MQPNGRGTDVLVIGSECSILENLFPGYDVRFVTKEFLCSEAWEGRTACVVSEAFCAELSVGNPLGALARKKIRNYVQNSGIYFRAARRDPNPFCDSPSLDFLDEDIFKPNCALLADVSSIYPSMRVHARHEAGKKSGAPSIVSMPVGLGVCVFLDFPFDSFENLGVSQIINEMGLMRQCVNCDDIKAFIIDHSEIWAHKYLRAKEATCFSFAYENGYKFQAKTAQAEDTVTAFLTTPRSLENAPILVQRLSLANINAVVFPRVTSTQTLLERDELLEHIPELVPVIALEQTSGRGRSKNKWISPKGILAFSFALAGEHSSALLQCVVSAVLRNAMEQASGNLKNASLVLKWPNDIYIKTLPSKFAKSEMWKIGGILISNPEVLSKPESPFDKIIVGCGVNLSISKNLGLVSLLDFMEEKPEYETLAVKILGMFLNTLRDLTKLPKDRLAEIMKSMYTKSWIHNGQEVTIGSNYKAVLRDLPCGFSCAQTSQGIKAKVIGVDSNGYMLVQEPLGNKYRISPTGNSFDLTKNLIHQKIC